MLKRLWCYPTLIAVTMSLSNALAQGSTTLQIDPQVCTFMVDESRCDIELRFRWTLNPSQSICVHLAQKSHPLFCAEKEINERRFKIAMSGDTQFELRDAHNQVLLTQTSVTVLKVANDKRPRRRHGWGVF